MNIVRRAYNKYGLRFFIEFTFHPVLVPLFSAWSWIRTLYASRVLLNGQWSRYSGFSPRNSLNSFFYKTQWLNINRYGRTGRSPVIGLGDHPLSRWFHLSLWSSFIYANAGAVTILCGTLAWGFSHLIWASVTPWYWVFLVTFTIVLSSTGFAMAFVLQNYNILGWMWLPMVFYGALVDNMVLAGLALLAGAFASVTMVVSASLILTVMAFAALRFELLLIFIPSGIKIVTHILPSLKGGGFKAGLINVAKMIGVTDKDVKYKRTRPRFGVANAYITALYTIGCIILWVAMDLFPILPVTALALFIINQRALRFMDQQSCYILSLSAFSAWTMLMPGSWYTYISLLLVANPLPLYIDMTSLSREKSLVKVPSLKPFDHSRLLNALETFFTQVTPGSRILMAFEDPGDNYWAVFDGNRILLEPALYVASKKEIHLFPDWYAVAETNYQGAPMFWGRSQQQVAANIARWNAEYAIVSPKKNNSFDPQWDHAFERLASFDWSEWDDFLGNEKLCPTDKGPTWYLLRKKESLSSSTCIIDDHGNQ